MSVSGALLRPAPHISLPLAPPDESHMLDLQRERTLIDDIEMRQNEVIKSLDELNDRIEEVLRREIGRKNAEAAATSVQMPGLVDGPQQPQAEYNTCPQA